MGKKLMEITPYSGIIDGIESWLFILKVIGILATLATIVVIIGIIGIGG